MRISDWSSDVCSSDLDTPPNSSEAEKGLTFDSRLPNGPVSAREASDLLTGVTGTRLLIILDEYDRVEDSGFRRQTAELIKNLSDRMAAVHVLIAGVAEDLDGLIDYIPSIRRNIAAIEVPAMTTPEVEEILRIGSETSGMTFADGSAERNANYRPEERRAGTEGVSKGRTRWWPEQ